MTVQVTYASKHGSTRGIAEAIGGRLRERGLDAEVRPVGEVDGLERYDALVSAARCISGRGGRRLAVTSPAAKGEVLRSGGLM